MKILFNKKELYYVSKFKVLEVIVDSGEPSHDLQKQPSATYSEIEAATKGVIYKKMFIKILQYLQKNTCVGVSF